MLIFCLKHTLTLENDVDVWLAKLVQGGYIPTRPPIIILQLLLPIFVCLEISIS